MENLYNLIKPDKDKEYEAINIDPENRMYLVCIAYSISGEGEWELLRGRTRVYDYIKTLMETTEIDIYESFVLVESLTLKDRKSIYAFMSYVKRFYDDGFDIEDYVDDDKYQGGSHIIPIDRTFASLLNGREPFSPLIQDDEDSESDI